MSRARHKTRGKRPGHWFSGKRGSKKRKKRNHEANGLKASALKWAKLALLCVVVAVLSFAAGGYLGVVRTVAKLPQPASISTHPTYIYSAPLGSTDGSRRVIGTIFQGENRRTASLNEMPPQLLNALVAKEDERFREHGGVDLWGIMRALFIDIRAGAPVEGASTITQQYVRNAYLSQDQTITRKIKEALIAVEVERVQGKHEILGNYLNTVYFGNNAYGVGAAAETYFNKSVEDLTTGECATLVGLVWSPSTLGTDREAATYQRNLVLKKMFDAGYITRQDYDEAKEEKLPDKWPVNPMVETGLTGPKITRDFSEMVESEMVKKYGANTVLRGGLSVYTTLDLNAQVKAEDIMSGPGGYLTIPDAPNAALVSIEPDTGKVRALVGDTDPNSQFNLATQARRQPGSSFKPFALIAALEQGIDPKTKFVSADKVYDVKLSHDKTEKWKVENYGGVERGPITLEDALWQSDNTVFTDLVMNADGKGLKNGPESVVRVAKKLGISADFGPHPHPSVVLGTQEVSPMDMATAYATIVNDGRRIEPSTITKVVRNKAHGDETTLYKAPSHPKGKQVIDPEIARKATEIMTGDVTRGIATEASLGNQPVAGKTGTSENFFDAWFIGSTPQLTTAVWMGYAKGGQTLEQLLGPEGQQLGAVGSPTIIWHDYMQSVLEGQPVEQFDGVEPIKPATDESAHR